MNNMKFIKCALIFLIIFSQNSFAEHHIRCTPATVAVQDKNIVLPGVDKAQSSQIYFMQNSSKESLWLDHPQGERSANAGWSSYFQPEKWSALLVNRKDFVISCAVIRPGKVNYQSCAKVITICIPEATSSAKRKGSYWLAENQSWDDLIIAIEKRGIKINRHKTNKENIVPQPKSLKVKSAPVEDKKE